MVGSSLAKLPFSRQPGRPARSGKRADEMPEFPGTVSTSLIRDVIWVWAACVTVSWLPDRTLAVTP